MDLTKKQKTILFIFALLIIFSIGYYLRAYLGVNTDLEGSPYELFSRDSSAIEFTEKQNIYSTNYSVTNLFSIIFNPFKLNFLDNLYIIYILGSIIIFIFGKIITKKYLGGLLAFSIFALSHENLLQYTKTIGYAGLSYCFILTSILFLYQYIQTKKLINLILFSFFSILTIMTYHTAGTVISLLLIGFLISLKFTNKELDKKIIFSFLGIFLFFIYWIIQIDRSQGFSILSIASTTTSSIFNLGFKIIFGIIIFLTIFFYTLFKLKNSEKFQSEYIPFMAVIFSIFLITFNLSIFNWILNLGVINYYISTTTLNQYFIQGILTHIYLIAFIPLFLNKNISKRMVFLRGWAIGLLLIFISFQQAGYIARILDYSIPFSAIIFAFYWTKMKKFKSIVVILTIILLISSQLIIYNDPFTMRRYYNQDEINSIKNIINKTNQLNLENKIIASDLRTSALFSYYGLKGVKFSTPKKNSIHNIIFYNPKRINSSDKTKNLDYIILSKNMKIILHSADFPTFPINNSLFEYYNKTSHLVYKDDMISIYGLN